MSIEEDVELRKDIFIDTERDLIVISDSYK